MEDLVSVWEGDSGLHQLLAEGVSPWLDGVCHRLVASGRLARLVREIPIRGAVSNVDVLVRAVGRDRHYRDRLAGLAERTASVDEAIRLLITNDMRRTAAELRPVFEKTGGADGQVSMDLDPRLADDAESTVREAVAAYRVVNRSNVLVKVLATDEGLVAMRECLGRGIGVHAAGIFSVRRYGEVLDAYFDGLELAVGAGLRPATLAAVTSFPVGLIDAEADARLDELGTSAARALRGRTALAIARLAYRLYDQRLGSDRWRELSTAGARPPRLMWTDTETPDSPYPVAWYINEFVAWGTVSAMSQSTVDDAIQAGGLHGDTLTNEHLAAGAVLTELEALGISVAELAERLERANLRRLVAGWCSLRKSVAEQWRATGRTPD